jgi:hypothetical protein
MSDTQSTTPEGNAELTVGGAADAILGLMGSDDGSEQEQPETQAEANDSEAESDETEAEYEASDESEVEQEDEQDEQQEPQKYRVKAAGEEREVTLEELVRGYQLEADYTKKTQTLAEERKSVEAERVRIQEATQLRDQYAQRLQMIEGMLQSQPQENLEALKETDPIGFAVKFAEQQQKEKQLAAIQAEQYRIAQMQQAEKSEILSKHVSSEAEKLSQAIPDFKDKEKGEAVRKEIRSFAKSVGWSDQELSSVYDSRAVLTLYKAMQYDKLMQNRPEVNKKLAQAPKMLRSGASAQRSPDQEGIKKQKQKLRSSGRVADAANLFERFL